MPRPTKTLVAADAVVVDRDRRVLFIRRRNPPYAGGLALPGGFVEPDETVEDACRRELAEETGILVRRLKLVGVYSDPGRDPRGRVVSIAFLARVPAAKVRAGDDAADAIWLSRWRTRDLAFDHARILADAMDLLRRTLS